MKITDSLTKILTAGSIALAIAFVPGFPSVAAAQEKGATMLLSAKASPAAASETPAMSCSKCKDGTVTITEKPTKTGAKANTYTVARHECPGCKSTLAINGHGKSATGTVAHTCQLSRAEGGSCCALKQVN